VADTNPQTDPTSEAQMSEASPDPGAPVRMLTSLDLNESVKKFSYLIIEILDFEKCRNVENGCQR